MADIPNTIENRAQIIASRRSLGLNMVRDVLEAAAELDAEIAAAVAQ